MVGPQVGLPSMGPCTASGEVGQRADPWSSTNRSLFVAISLRCPEYTTSSRSSRDCHMRAQVSHAATLDTPATRLSHHYSGWMLTVLQACMKALATAFSPSSFACASASLIRCKPAATSYLGSVRLGLKRSSHSAATTACQTAAGATGKPWVAACHMWHR